VRSRLVWGAALKGVVFSEKVCEKRKESYNGAPARSRGLGEATWEWASLYLLRYEYRRQEGRIAGGRLAFSVKEMGGALPAGTE